MSECWVCQEGAEVGEITHSGCACRGSAGLVHISCLVAWADSEAAGNKLKDNSWRVCPTCEQMYAGHARIGLARALLERMCHPRQTAHSDTPIQQASSSGHLLADAEDKRLWATMNLASALTMADGVHRNYPEALCLYQEALLGYQTAAQGQEDQNTLGAMAGVAVTHKQMGNLSEALRLTVECEAAHRRVLGIEHPNTLSQMGNLAAMYEDADSRHTDKFAARQVRMSMSPVYIIMFPFELQYRNRLLRVYQSNSDWCRSPWLAVERAVLGGKTADTWR
jgi:hypothetical protein